MGLVNEEYPGKVSRVEYFNRAFGKGVFAGRLNIIMRVVYLIVTALYARAFGAYGIALPSLNESRIWLAHLKQREAAKCHMVAGFRNSCAYSSAFLLRFLCRCL